MIGRIVTVTMQQSLLVSVNGDRAQGYRRSFNFTQFIEWLDEEGISSFLFRPANPEDNDVIDGRVAEIEMAGFIVIESNDPHYFKYAYR